MTGQERDCDDVLGRVLHSTTDQIEPVGDGLTKIQARLAEPWLKRQWWLLRSELMVLGWVLTVRCQSWLSTVRSGSPDGGDAGGGTAGEASIAVGAGAAGDGGWLGSLRPVLGGIAAWASGKRPHKSSVGLAMAWLRPALAVAGAVVLVVAGVFALGQIRAVVSLSAGGITTGTSGQAGGPGSTNGRNEAAFPGGQSPSQGSHIFPKHGRTPRSKLATAPAACASSAPPANASPTPPASPTPTPDPTPSTLSPSPSTANPSPNTSTGPAAGSQTQTIRTTAQVVCEPAPSASPSPTNQATNAP